MVVQRIATAGARVCTSVPARRPPAGKRALRQSPRAILDATGSPGASRISSDRRPELLVRASARAANQSTEGDVPVRAAGAAAPEAGASATRADPTRGRRARARQARSSSRGSSRSSPALALAQWPGRPAARAGGPPGDRPGCRPATTRSSSASESPGPRPRSATSFSRGHGPPPSAAPVHAARERRVPETWRRRRRDPRFQNRALNAKNALILVVGLAQARREACARMSRRSSYARSLMQGTSALPGPPSG